VLKCSKTNPQQPKLGTEIVTNDRIEKRAHIIGWGLFIICALFFLVSSIVNKDAFAFVGSLTFLLACFVFLFPLLCTNNQKQKQEKQHDNIP